jgi:hypothetical protein
MYVEYQPVILLDSRNHDMKCHDIKWKNVGCICTKLAGALKQYLHSTSERSNWPGNYLHRRVFLV